MNRMTCVCNGSGSDGCAPAGHGGSYSEACRVTGFTETDDLPETVWRFLARLNASLVAEIESVRWRQRRQLKAAQADRWALFRAERGRLVLDGVRGADWTPHLRHLAQLQPIPRVVQLPHRVYND